MYEDSEIEGYAPWFVLIITVMGGFLRVLLLGSKGMWLDETFSVWMAGHSVGEMLGWLVRIDQHPPLYYLLLHGWNALGGETPYHVRLFSALFGAATIPIIYLIGKRMSGLAMGLAAAVFLALSPLSIYFAQETRMYTLLTFNAAVAIYALVRLLTDARAAAPAAVRPAAAGPIGGQLRAYLHAWRTAAPVEPDAPTEFSYRDRLPPPTGLRAWLSRHRPPPIRAIATDLAWIAFIVFSAATLYSHNTAILFPLAVNVFVLGLMLFQRIKKSEAQPGFRAPSPANWAKAQLAIFLLWLPWLFFFIRQAGAVYGRFWIPAPTAEAVIRTLGTFLNASAPMPADQGRIIWGLYALVLCLGLVHFRREPSKFLFLAALFVVPFAGELIVSIWRPIFYGRTLIWTTIPLFLLLAAGVAQLRFGLLMVAVVGIFGAINLFAAGDYLRSYQKEDWSTPAGYVANFAEEGDLVLFNSNFVAIPFNYYFKPFEDLYSIQVEKQGLPLDLFESGVLEPEMTPADAPALTELLREHDRVWLVYSHDSYTDPTGLIPETLAAQKALIREREFYGGMVQLYGND